MSQENQKRLQFMHDLLLVLNISKHEMARRLGMSPQNFFTYLKRDDMRLSFAQEIADNLGFELSVRLEREEGDTQEVIKRIEPLVRCDEKLRLGFLKITLGIYNITKIELAEKLGLNPGGVFRWFRVDDIAISYLYDIAKAYNLQVIFNLKRKVQ